MELVHAGMMVDAELASQSLGQELSRHDADTGHEDA